MEVETPDRKQILFKLVQQIIPKKGKVTFC